MLDGALDAERVVEVARVLAMTASYSGTRIRAVLVPQLRP